MFNELMDEFNALYGIENLPIYVNQVHMVSMINDEVVELKEEIFRDSKDYIKEAIDVLYITAQQLRMRGVDVDAAFKEVHRSNMSKALVTGTIEEADAELDIAQLRYPHAAIVPSTDCLHLVLRDLHSGKVIRPTTYSPAVISDDMCKYL